MSQPKVSQVRVLTETRSTDKVYLTLEGVTATVYPYGDQEVTASLEVASGRGVAWAQANYPGVPTEVIDCKSGTSTVI